MKNEMRQGEVSILSKHTKMSDMITKHLKMVNQEKMIRNNSPIVRTMPGN